MVIPLHERQDRVARLLAGTSGVLLPGSPFDVDPQRYGAKKIPECHGEDAARNAVDELLLQDAFNLRKPILAICYGVQSLNVWRNGTLIQDLPSEGYSAVNHTPGRAVEHAHEIAIAPGSRLASIAPEGILRDQVNSSHHQSLGVPGDNLRVVAVSPVDQVIEAVELDSPDQFAVGVQWHPERTFATNALSRALFQAFVKAATEWRPLQPQE